jgi:hypothetical protein
MPVPGRQNPVQRNGFIERINVAIKHRVDRDQVVAAIDLDLCPAKWTMATSASRALAEKSRSARRIWLMARLRLRSTTSKPAFSGIADIASAGP